MPYDLQFRSKHLKVALVCGLQPPIVNFSIIIYFVFFVDILVDPYEILTFGMKILKTAQIKKKRSL